MNSLVRVFQKYNNGYCGEYGEHTLGYVNNIEDAYRVSAKHYKNYIGNLYGNAMVFDALDIPVNEKDIELVLKKYEIELVLGKYVLMLKEVYEKELNLGCCCSATMSEFTEIIGSLVVLENIDSDCDGYGWEIERWLGGEI